MYDNKAIEGVLIMYVFIFFPPLLKENLKGAQLISHMSISDTGMYSRREAAAAQGSRKKRRKKPVVI